MPFIFLPSAASDFRCAAVLLRRFSHSTAGVRPTVAVLWLSVEVLTLLCFWISPAYVVGLSLVLGCCLARLQFCCAAVEKEAQLVFPYVTLCQSSLSYLGLAELAFV